MTSDQIRTLHHARPFRPFTMHLADDTSVAVTHPEIMLHTQGGRTVIVNTEGESIAIVDLLLVAKVTVSNGSPSRRRRS